MSIDSAGKMSQSRAINSYADVARLAWVIVSFVLSFLKALFIVPCPEICNRSGTVAFQSGQDNFRCLFDGELFPSALWSKNRSRAFITAIRHHSKWAEIGQPSGSGIQRIERVRDSLNRAMTFFNRFLGFVKIEQAQVSKSWCH